MMVVWRETAVLATKEVSWLRNQLDAAHQTIVELRREGFNPPEHIEAWSNTIPADKLPAEVMIAIETIAEPGDRLYEQLIGLASADLEDGANPEAVAESVLKGGDYNPYN